MGLGSEFANKERPLPSAGLVGGLGWSRGFRLAEGELVKGRKGFGDGSSWRGKEVPWGWQQDPVPGGGQGAKWRYLINRCLGVWEGNG